MKPTCYPFAIKTLHWLMALVFIFMWSSGWYMTNMAVENSQLEDWLYSLHISTGVSLIVLLAIRVYLRVTRELPSAVAGLSGWQLKAAHWGHLGLYLLPALVLLLGWAEVDVGGHGVAWFGIEMPKIFPTIENVAGVNLENFTEEAHELLAYTMLGLVLVHVAAVIKHQWFDGHNVMDRMK